MRVLGATAAVAALALASLSPALVRADEAMLRSQITQALSERVGVAAEAQAQAQVQADVEAGAEAEGIQNCFNKCQNVFSHTAYALQTQLGDDTYEYKACIVGCQVCSQQLATPGADAGTCFDVCKNTDWNAAVDENGNPTVIQKGIIEPDKACIMGCIINTCQGVCTGGTTDMKVTAANVKSWWNPPSTTGCSIKTGSVRPGGYYTQNSQYNYWNAPAGQGGQDACCSQAFNTCNYSGNKNSANYKNGVGVLQRVCSDVPGTGKTVTSICNWFSVASNCGSPATA